jgi:hypothetical protein
MFRILYVSCGDAWRAHSLGYMISGFVSVFDTTSLVHQIYTSCNPQGKSMTAHCIPCVVNLSL